ncbi:hypothetical protein [Gemmatimonas sp.]|uniref:hypothetical protein n=1 Tax=Gemmatimonas sp. TaxID=1962908 RepID=UPI0033403897
MLDPRAAKGGLRARMVATVVATTGLVTLSATSMGYARTTGSFVADGFLPGMEITPTGFSNSAVEVVTDVQPLALTVRTSHPAQAAAGTRSLVARLPQRRAFDGAPLELVPDTLALREEYVPAPSDTITTSPNGGLTTESGFYVVTLFAPVGASAVLDSMGHALKRRFAGGTLIDAGDVTLRCTQRPGPSLGQILPYETPGVVFRAVRIPWSAQTRAAVLP